MSRFRLFAAFEASVGGQRQLLPAGTTIANSFENCAHGDLVCPSLTAFPNARMVPLDEPAVELMIAMGFKDAAIGKPVSGPDNWGRVLIG